MQENNSDNPGDTPGDKPDINGSQTGGKQENSAGNDSRAGNGESKQSENNGQARSDEVQLDAENPQNGNDEPNSDQKDSQNGSDDTQPEINGDRAPGDDIGAETNKGQDDSDGVQIKINETKSGYEEEKEKKNKKIFILIGIAIGVVILIILLLLLLLFCTNKDIPNNQATDAANTSEALNNGTQDDEDSGSKTSNETDGASSDTTSVSETTAVSTTDATEETDPETEDTAVVLEKPTIRLVIDEGPIYSPADGVCFYRIKAIVTGNPAPRVSWSKNDGEGLGGYVTQINLSSPSDTYTIIGTATNAAGSQNASMPLSWGCNRPPDITAINLPAELLTSTQYSVSATASDPDGDVLTYSWSVASGSINNAGLNPMQWTTPSSPGSYNITVTVNDGKGGTDTFNKPVVVMGQNRPPTVSSIQLKDIKTSKVVDTAQPYNYYEISVNASDPDGDILSFSWEAVGIYPGSISNPNNNPALWQAPYSAGFVTIRVTVDDGRGGVVTRTRDIEVKSYVY